MLKNIVGRQREKRILKKTLESPKSEFVAVYGRRRVGKTFLIREFFDHRFDFHLTGMANADMRQQLTNFNTSLFRQSDLQYSKRPKNWFEAFQRLVDLLESI